MGYTHYWRRPKTAARPKFWLLTQDAIRLIDSGLYEARICGGDGTGEAVLTAEEITFNGDAGSDLDHETFTLTPTRVDFDFCKTARKPYDVLVTAVLIRAAHHFPSWDISSDGDPEDWADGLELCRRVFGEARLPKGVEPGGA